MISKKVERYKSGVYKITNLINGKIYIGSSVEVYNRYHAHKNKLKTKTHSCKHLIYAYHKYGFDNFLFEVLEYCTNITEREQYYINLLKPEYNKRNIAQNNIGLRVSNETKLKISQTLKEKYKKGLKSYNQKHKWKKVEQYDLKGNFIQEFENPKAAEIFLNIKFSKISNACKLNVFTSCGFQWKYKDSDKLIQKSISNGRKIIVCDVKENVNYEFNSLIRCSKFFKVKSINRPLKTGKLYKKRYFIKYKDLIKSDKLLETPQSEDNQQPI